MNEDGKTLCSLHHAGFTLLEMLLVVLLTGIIFSLILPKEIIKKTDTFPIMFKELLTSAALSAYSSNQAVLIKIHEDGIYYGSKHVRLPDHITPKQENQIEIGRYGIMSLGETTFIAGQEELVFKTGLFGLTGTSVIRK